jgi:hypothetical protein
MDDFADLHGGRGIGQKCVAPTRRVGMRLSGADQALTCDPRLDGMMDAARLSVIGHLGNGKGDGLGVDHVVEAFTAFYRFRIASGFGDLDGSSPMTVAVWKVEPGATVAWLVTAYPHR